MNKWFEDKVWITKNACLDVNWLDWTGEYLSYLICKHIREEKKELYDALLEWDSLHYDCPNRKECLKKALFVTDPKEIF